MPPSFVTLSELLTGFENLDPRLASLYYEALETHAGGLIQPLIGRFGQLVREAGGIASEAIIQDGIWPDAAMQPACQLLIVLWYTGRLDTTTVTPPGIKWIAPEAAYYEALLWKAIQAHPPALSGGYFGYWRYAPEN